MTRHTDHLDPAAYDTALQRVIAARVEAIRKDIRLKRPSTIRAIEDILSHTEFQALTIRVAVTAGRTVGYLVVDQVEQAIQTYAEQLAEGDMLEMDRARKESADDNRIAMAQCDRLLAA